MSKLPPLHNLPSWSRSSLERRKVQRYIAKDPETPIQKSGHTISPKVSLSERPLSMGQASRSNSNTRIVSAPSSAALNEKAVSRKETQLRNSINFLKQQHQDTLEKLHEELEKLKLENKELNFKLVVSKEKKPSSPASAESKPRSGSYYRSKIRRLENEMKTMKLTLVEAQKQNIDISKRLQERELSGKKYRPLPPVASGRQQGPQNQEEVNTGVASTSVSEPCLSSPESSNRKDQAIEHLKLFSPGKTTVLQVTLGKRGDIYVQPSTGPGPRSPTMAECKDIIHHLEDTNKKQGLELSKLKEELKGSNTYVVTKTLSSRSHYNDQNSVMLPALRPAGSGSVQADRRRGQQALMRGRGGKTRDVNY